MTEQYWKERIKYYQRQIGKCEREMRELKNKAQ